MIRYIRAICSILVILVIIVSLILFFGFGYNYNKDNSKDCAFFYEDYSNPNNELYYLKINDLCCHFVLDNNDKIVEECLKYE